MISKDDLGPQAGRGLRRFLDNPTASDLDEITSSYTDIIAELKSEIEWIKESLDNLTN